MTKTENYYEDMEFRELLRIFVGKAAGLMNPDNSHLVESGEYFLMSADKVVEFGDSLNAIIEKVFQDAKRDKEEKTKLAETVAAESGIEVEVEDKKGYVVPENVIITLGQLRGWKIDLNNFEEVSSELREMGDLDVLDWVYRNPVAYRWFIKKKAW